MNPPQYFDLPDQGRRSATAGGSQVDGQFAAPDGRPICAESEEIPRHRHGRGPAGYLARHNQDLDKALTRLGIAHKFETYEGNHMSRVKERYAANVLPFFSANLTFETRPAKAK